MNLKLCGICFKMRGGPDLLDYVQSNEPVPVDVMNQVMSQMGSITKEDMDFAKKLNKDWKAAVSEKVPLLMGVASDGGYDITCRVPDEMLDVVHKLYGLENEKIVEEFVKSYLKNVCGLDADIISVDVNKEEETAEKPAQAAGFNLDDLDEDIEEPAFEDVSAFAEMDDEAGAALSDRPDMEGPAPEDIPDEEPYEEPEYGDDYGLGEDYPDEDIPDEEAAEEEPHEDEISEGGQDKEPESESEGDKRANDIKNIYTELVGNIRDKGLDERLGIKIGQ